MLFNPLWLVFAIPGLILGIYAQIRLSAAHRKYAQQGVESGLSGAEAAREILNQAGLTNVPVDEVGGHLTDHYNPVRRALFLSTDNYHGHAIAAVGVARSRTRSSASKGLHAVQLAHGSGSSHAARGDRHFRRDDILQLVTLPVEYDASRRAKDQLFRLGLVHEHERAGVSKVLDAAALTYVAALFSTVMELLYFISTARSNRN